MTMPEEYAFEHDEEKITIEMDLKITYRLSNNEEKTTTLNSYEIEVERTEWQEDMHPDGLGYYMTFVEPDDKALDNYLDDLVGYIKTEEQIRLVEFILDKEEIPEAYTIEEILKVE